MDFASGINIENAGPLVVGQVPAKVRKKHHKPHENCQNCGATLTGDYCYECGQHGHVHRSVLHVVEEVVHGITHLDSRAWRSLPMLALRPGTLTRNYVMGKRARYVPPFAMFLFSIFAMFLVFAFSGGPGLVQHVPSGKEEAVSNARDAVRDAESDLRDAQSDVRDAQAELRELRADPDTSQGAIGSATGAIGAALGQVSGAQARVDQAKAALSRVSATPEVKASPAKGDASVVTASKTGAVTGSPTFTTQADKDEALTEIAAEKAKAQKEGNAIELGALTLAEKVAQAAPIVEPNPSSRTADKAGAPPNAKIDIEIAGSRAKVETGGSEDIMTMLKDSMRRGEFIVTPWPEINKKIAAKTQNPDLFIYKLQNTAYKFSFLFVPLSLPFIWLMLFWKRDVTLFDHAVFSLYSLSFVSFLFIFISLGNRFLPLSQLFGLAAIIMPIHIFFQFKGAYELKWFSAFWRTALFCGVFSWVVILVFFLSIIALGVTG
jgi:Protein of unknown function (DUF3667)